MPRQPIFAHSRRRVHAEVAVPARFVLEQVEKQVEKIEKEAPHFRQMRVRARMAGRMVLAGERIRWECAPIGAAPTSRMRTACAAVQIRGRRKAASFN